MIIAVPPWPMKVSVNGELATPEVEVLTTFGKAVVALDRSSQVLSETVGQAKVADLRLQCCKPLIDIGRQLFPALAFDHPG